MQQSEQYQATVVPLANIIDIGFVAMTPFILEISGIMTPFTMLGLCALGFAMGWVMRLNIKRYEPVADKNLVGYREPSISVHQRYLVSI
ncbi:hypothetical protein [Salinigranum marinum]|uniref:hypothetical protein n=1 Tax=Salinigranum marinum TaxID=1515595 RepID=UPI002989A0F7|nr:hypothetical protein [Salinigranum marinum]